MINLSLYHWDRKIGYWNDWGIPQRNQLRGSAYLYKCVCIQITSTKLVVNELSPRTWKRLRENILKLIIRVDKLNINFLSENFFLDKKVTINCYMLGSIMKDWIWCNVDSSLIITNPRSFDQHCQTSTYKVTL